MKEAMRIVTLLALFAFVAQAHAEEAAANDNVIHKFVDKLVDAVSDKLEETGEEAVEDTEMEENEENEEGNETEEDDEHEDEDGEEGEETMEEEAIHEEGNEIKEVMDELADKLVDRVLQASLPHNADLDTATLAKPGDLGIPFLSSDDQLQEDLAFDNTAQIEDYNNADGSMLPDVLGLRGGAAGTKAMKAMKKVKAMNALRAMKAMKAKKKAKKLVSKIAKGKRAKVVVFQGNKEKTQSGLTKSDLMKNKRGKIVSKKKTAAGKKAYNNIKGWVSAVMKARKAMKVKGFVPIKKGTPLYRKAKSLYR